MSKTMMYRLFRFGSIPKELRKMLARERIVVLDEGMRGWFITGHVDAPGKRFRHRREGFTGFVVVTKQRVICYGHGKRQINIAVEDPKIAKLYVATSGARQLRLSFESSEFREGWEGVIEFRFNTAKARRFRDALLAVGAQEGTATN